MGMQRIQIIQNHTKSIFTDKAAVHFFCSTCSFIYILIYFMQLHFYLFATPFAQTDKKGELKMTKHIFVQYHHEYFEYHGNTIVERIRKGTGNTISRDWIIFDSVEEAQDYFHNNCEV